MSIRLIAVDLDGTLLSSDGATVHERNIRALRRAAEKGAKIVLASGRSLVMMEDAAEQLGCVNYIISSLGGTVTDYATRKILDEKGIDPDKRRAILEVLRPFKPLIEVYCDNRIYAEQAILTAHPPVSDFDFLRARYDDTVEDLETAIGERMTEKLDVDFIPDDETMELIRTRVEALGDLCVLAYPGDGYIEISHIGATKGNALRFLCRHLGIDAGEVLALGDSDNDVDMFEWAGCAVAMARASAMARQAADRVTGSNNDGGVGQAVEELMDQIGDR